MLDKLKHLLTGDSAALNEARHSEPLAVCAVLLEVAESDFDVASEELNTIHDLLAERYGLSREAAQQLITEARQARAAEPDLWSFTTTLAHQYGPEEKGRILEMVWRVIFSDGRLDPYEDQLAAKLRGMLSVNHSVLIDAKLRARQALATADASAD